MNVKTVGECGIFRYTAPAAVLLLRWPVSCPFAEKNTLFMVNAHSLLRLRYSFHHAQKSHVPRIRLSLSRRRCNKIECHGQRILTVVLSSKASVTELSTVADSVYSSLSNSVSSTGTVSPLVARCLLSTSDY